jgi:hypothetical protein
MSMVDLSIGKLPDELEETALAQLEERGLSHLTEWQQYDGATEEINLLNLASVVFFTDYVAELEGHDGWEGSEKSRFKNLPNFREHIWLPARFKASPEGVPGDSTFLGSCPNLLDELAEIQRLSTLSLATVPVAYLDMRKDLRAFYRASLTSSSTVPDDDIIRWIWRGLWEGAELAIRNGAPMLCLMG